MRLQSTRVLRHFDASQFFILNILLLFRCLVFNLTVNKLFFTPITDSGKFNIERFHPNFKNIENV